MLKEFEFIFKFGGAAAEQKPAAAVVEKQHWAEEKKVTGCCRLKILESPEK